MATRMYGEEWVGGVVVARHDSRVARMVARVANLSRLTAMLTWPLLAVLSKMKRLVVLSEWEVNNLFVLGPKSKDEPISPFVRRLKRRPMTEVSETLATASWINPSTLGSTARSAIKLMLFRWEVEEVTGLGSTSGLGSISDLRKFLRKYEEEHLPLTRPT